MRLLPYDAFAIETSATVPQLVEALQAQVEPRKWLRWGWSGNHKLFEGEVMESGFNLSRIISYRNSWLPTVTGTFEPGPMGTTVQVKMKLSPFVILFMIVWTGFVLQFFVFGLLSLLSDPGEMMDLGPFLAIPGGMILFFWVISSAAFWFEARKARKALEEILGMYGRNTFGT